MQLEPIESTYTNKRKAMTTRDRGRRVWTLSAQEEVVLKQCTAHFFKLWGYDLNLSVADIAKDEWFTSSVAASDSRRLGHLTKEDFAECDSNSLDDIVEPIPPALRRSFSSVYDMEIWLEGTSTNGEYISVERKDYYSSYKPDPSHVHPKLRGYHAGGLQRQFITCLRNDLPDNLLLRFLVSNEFRVAPTLEMVAKTLLWRGQLHPVDSWTQAGDAEPTFNQEKPQFLAAFRTGQVYIRGVDRKNSPLCHIHVRKHRRLACSDRDFERFVCVHVEWIRLMLAAYNSDVDAAAMFFDMTNMGLKNLDLAFVRFITAIFNSRYPECINLIIIHNAPLVFYLFWKLIRSWLGPTLESKIKFTRSAADVAQYVDPKHIPRRLGGQDDYVPRYIEPTLQTSSRKAHDKVFHDLHEERRELLMLWLVVSVQWIEARTPEESFKYLKQKVKVGLVLAKNYIKLDPYYRSRGLVDRLGQLEKMLY